MKATSAHRQDRDLGLGFRNIEVLVCFRNTSLLLFCVHIHFFGRKGYSVYIFTDAYES